MERPTERPPEDSTRPLRTNRLRHPAAAATTGRCRRKALVRGTTGLRQLDENGINGIEWKHDSPAHRHGWLEHPQATRRPIPQHGTHLERYSQTFSCAEINSSFYRSHRPSTWIKWAASVPEDFRFSVKAPKTITHESSLACSSQQLTNFLTEARTLGSRLGPIFFQLPPKFIFNPAEAKAFFTMFRDHHPGPTVLEPRNPTWFTPEADDLLRKFHIARAAADPARTPAAATAGGWPHPLYCRLHGSPRMYYSPYPETYLQSLASNIANHHAQETWCVFDNTASGAALGNALTLQSLLASPSNQFFGSSSAEEPTSRPASYQSPPAPADP